MQNLVPCRFHARALPGGEDDGGERAGGGRFGHAACDAIMPRTWEALPAPLPTPAKLPLGRIDAARHHRLRSRRHACRYRARSVRGARTMRLACWAGPVCRRMTCVTWSAMARASCSKKGWRRPARYHAGSGRSRGGAFPGLLCRSYRRWFAALSGRRSGAGCAGGGRDRGWRSAPTSRLACRGRWYRRWAGTGALSPIWALIRCRRPSPIRGICSPRLPRPAAIPATTVFVGDSITDTTTALNAGVPVIAVSFGFSDRPVADLGADLVIDHYDELLPALRRLVAV